jgi:hypothetical protein
VNVSSRFAAWSSAKSLLVHLGMFVTGVGFAESKRSVGCSDSLIALIICRIVILMIRTWAVWDRDRRLAIGLPMFFVSVWCALCIYAARYLNSLDSMYSVAFRSSCSDHSIDKIINFKSQANATTNSSSKLFGYWTQLHSIRGMGSGDGI